MPQRFSVLIVVFILGLKLLVSGFMDVMHLFRRLPPNPSHLVNAGSLSHSMFLRRITSPANSLFPAVRFPQQVTTTVPPSSETIPNRFSSKRNCVGAGERKGRVDTGMFLAFFVWVSLTCPGTNVNSLILPENCVPFPVIQNTKPNSAKPSLRYLVLPHLCSLLNIFDE